jgi:hypothetical protein
MQYFTPELFVRLQDLRDRGAMQEWDRASERYSAALKSMVTRLPAAVKKLAGRYHLHDAEILCISHLGDNLSITLQPEGEDEYLLVLSYTLVADPEINPSAIPEKYRTEYVAWLYDEISVGKPVAQRPSRRKGTATGNSHVPVYCHDMLLSNGWELFLRFRQLKVTRPKRLLPAPRPADGKPDGELSQSA